MKYATVMVSLALDQPNEACLAVAGDLAERFKAHVIGIAASDFRPPLYFAEGAYAEELLEQEQASVDKRLDELEVQFRASLTQRAKTLEWRSALEMPTRYVIEESRAADILVTGARSEADSDSYSLADPNDLLMQAGRPLLIVPSAIEWLDTRSILVAWKDTTEARKAIVDALPLLSLAKDITVVEVVEESVKRPDALLRVKDVVEWLSRHGISAGELAADGGGDIAAQLDEIASDVGAGVVVAGAYGHSRLREWVLGGVTRHFVSQPNRCSLLSR